MSVNRTVASRQLKFFVVSDLNFVSDQEFCVRSELRKVQISTSLIVVDPKIFCSMGAVLCGGLSLWSVTAPVSPMTRTSSDAQGFAVMVSIEARIFSKSAQSYSVLTSPNPDLTIRYGCALCNCGLCC